MKNKPLEANKNYREAILEHIKASGDSVYDIAREEKINRRTLQDFLHKLEPSKQQEIMQKLLDRYGLEIKPTRRGDAEETIMLRAKVVSNVFENGYVWVSAETWDELKESAVDAVREHRVVGLNGATDFEIQPLDNQRSGEVQVTAGWLE